VAVCLHTQGGDAATYPVLRSTWIDTLLPLAAFKADGSSSSSTHAGSKWFGSSSRKKQAAAAAAALAQEAPDPPSGYAFEAANILLAVATWKMTKAGSIVGAAAGADSAAAMDAYQLYCQAAGLLDELRRKLLPLVPSSACGDLQRELLCALHYFALGEAQVRPIDQPSAGTQSTASFQSALPEHTCRKSCGKS